MVGGDSSYNKACSASAAEKETLILPLTNQTASILKVPEREIGRLGVGMMASFLHGAL